MILITVCRIDMDVSNAEGIMETADIPNIFRMKANRTRTPIDCTWVIYADPGHRVSL